MSRVPTGLIKFHEELLERQKQHDLCSFDGFMSRENRHTLWSRILPPAGGAGGGAKISTLKSPPGLSHQGQKPVKHTPWSLGEQKHLKAVGQSTDSFCPSLGGTQPGPDV